MLRAMREVDRLQSYRVPRAQELARQILHGLDGVNWSLEARCVRQFNVSSFKNLPYRPGKSAVCANFQDHVHVRPFGGEFGRAEAHIIECLAEQNWICHV